MQIHYLDVVTKEVDAVCAAYAAANGVQFGKPDAGLGNARTAKTPGGGLVGSRHLPHLPPGQHRSRLLATVATTP
jgi:hypothetical protein